VLLEVADDNRVILSRIWISWVKFVVGNCRPVHATLSSAIDDTRVDLTKDLTSMIMEASADADANSPKLDMAKYLVRVVCCSNMKPYQIIELQAL
jgi:hypothetical protein